MPKEFYVFSEQTYGRLAAAGVSPISALHVLSNPVVRRHIGAVLTVAGQDRDGVWLTVALITNVRQMRGEEL